MYHPSLNVNLMEENVIQINGGITVNVDVSIKNVMSMEKVIFGKIENGKYLANIMYESAITCNEVIESYDEKAKTISRNFNEKRATCIIPNFYILIA